MKVLMKQRSKQQQGFTLIELVIVIVILGILAATAAPKFIDLQDDAKKAALEAVGASMESTVSLVNAKAIIADEVGGTGKVSIALGGTSSDYALINGYPTAETVTGSGSGAGAGIFGLLELGSEFAATYPNGVLTVTYKSCTITYTDSQDPGVRPVIGAPTCS